MTLVIDKELLTVDTERRLPDVALAVNQLTSAQAMRAFVLVSMTLVIGFLLVMGREVHEYLWWGYGIIIATLFDATDIVNRYLDKDNGK